MTTPKYAMGALPPEKVDSLIAKMAAMPLGISAAVESEAVYAWSQRPLSPSVDLRPYCSPVEDQLQWGTCTANTSVGAAELFMKRAGQFLDGVSDLSRTYNYWWAGTLDGWEGRDCGRTVRNALRAANLYGLCLETTAPYAADGITHPPLPAANTEAMQHVVNSFSAIAPGEKPTDALLAVKQALNDGYPVSMAFSVRRWVFDVNGTLDTHAAIPGKLTAKDPRNATVGNHDVLVVGYDDPGGYLIVRNSWGDAWGDGGYWAMSYASAAADAYEFWAIQDFNHLGVNPPEPPLSTAEVEATRQRLLAKGLAHISPAGVYQFGPLGMEAYGCASIALCLREGKSIPNIAQVAGVEPDTLAVFMDTNKAMIEAWESALK